MTNRPAEIPIELSPPDSVPRRRIRSPIGTIPAATVRLTFAILLALAAGFSREVSVAEIDAVGFRAFECLDLPTPSHWDNLEGEPQWLCGEKPRRAATSTLHEVSLIPGRSVTFRAPAGSAIRVLRSFGPISSDDVEVWISNGSGLYRRQSATVFPDARSMVFIPLRRQPVLVRVTRPSRHLESMTFALFTSRQEPVELLLGYRTLLDDGGPLVTLRRDDQAKGQPHMRVCPGRARCLSIDGPARLAVQTQLHYPPCESKALQAYRVYLRVDGRPHRLLDYETVLQRRHLVLADGRPIAVGQKATGYVDIPPGSHRVELDATATLYVRVLASFDDDYLLPRWNGPLWPPRAGERSLSPAGWTSIWNLPQHWLDRPRPDTHLPIDAWESIVRRSVRDNTYREGGLRGAMSMRRLQARHPEDPQLRVLAAKLLDHHTHYRNLLPAEMPHPKVQTFAWCSRCRPRDLGERPYNPILAEQLIDNTLSRLSGAFFVEAGSTPQRANRYRIPAEAGPTWLRVVVDRRLTGPASLHVQFDDQPPIEFEAVCREPLLADDYGLSDARAGLSALHWQHAQSAAGTLGGPFGRLRTPAFQVPAATAELLLPAGIGEVRVWADAASRPRVALQYRTSNPSRLSESEYVDIERRAASSQTRKAEFPTRFDIASLSARELENHRVPVARLLKAHERQFTAAIVPPTSNRQAEKPFSAAKQEALAEKASQLAGENHWLPVLEICAALLPHAKGELRRQTLMHRATALENLGESHLTQKLLRGTFLFDPDSHARRDAFEHLRHICQRAADTNGLELLAAVAYLRDPAPSRLRDLANALVENDRHEFALITALMADPNERPTTTVLRAAYRQRWWDCFEQAFDRLTDPQQRCYWRGYRHVASGDYGRARRCFEKGGPAGIPLAEHLEQGLGIHRRLASARLETRIKAILDWEEWWNRHPGPYVWRDDPSLVTEFSGAESVHSINRDTYAWFYRAEPSRPLGLSVVGPTRLKFEVRPLHGEQFEEPVDDWIYIFHSPEEFAEEDSPAPETGVRPLPRATWRNQCHLVAINGNAPSTGLTIVGNNGFTPGTKVETELALGPGIHHLEIRGDTSDLLVRAYARCPERLLPVLPPPNRDSLQAVLEGRYADTPIACASSTAPSCVLVLPRQAELPVACPAIRPVASPRPDTPGTLENRLAQLEAARRASAEGPGANTPSDRADDAIVRDMTWLVYQAETDPKQAPRCLVAGKMLFDKHPRVTRLADLHRRLSRKTAWKPLDTIHGSAGKRAIGISGWEPETPSVRVRKSLLGQYPPGGNVLSGYRHLIMTFDNQTPTELELSLFLAAPEGCSAQSVTVFLQQDNTQPRKVVLPEKGARHTLPLSIPAGSHYIRFRIDEPITNQYVLVRAVELRRVGTRPGKTEKVLLLDETHRYYEVATHDEPVRLHIEGPSYLRIDQRTEDGATISRTVAMGQGIQELELKPEPGREEALFRIAMCVNEPKRKTSKLHLVKRDPLPVAEPLLAAERADSLRVQADVFNPHPLGRQEDGTWSFGLGAFQRRALEEGLEGRQPDEFLQLTASHRYFDPWRHNHWKTDAILRPRENSGPTFALREHMRHDLQSIPGSLHFDAAGWLQRPQGLLPETEHTEWSLRFSGRFTQYRQWSPTAYHTPSVLLFGRFLSLSENPYPAARIDQDIFTAYKSDHRFGYLLSDTLVWRPQIDTRWSLRPALVGNENFSADNLSLHTGWALALGDAEIALAHRVTWFLEDEDRRAASTRHLLYAELSLHRGRSFPHRWDLGCRVIQDLTQGGTSSTLTWTYHFDNGRNYRDYLPSELKFPKLRNHRITARTHQEPPLWR